ncbi:MAG: acyl-CoA dehydrogenase family protein [Dehalococcoidia bacterium]|nr:acyl-CoA dehydrogenase family protein [Dehalococcoidia bacterium]MDW8119114.1 acyl-CoA dehydrogenase family protein [Chloroflexota bacterium]
MEYRFTPQEEAFRQEVRAFLQRELPPGYTGPVTLGDEEDEALHRRMQRLLAQKGWLTIGWPKEYGGQAASQITQTIFAEEVAYFRAPGVDTSGIKMLGPTLMLWGTEEQKREFLPPIARGEVNWCQGYSEPGSGSDLASLQTRAVADGDDFIINGSKIWTSRAHRADWMFLLARTNPDAPKHRGITFFLVSMRSPGVQVRPIVNMAGVHHFNQVFFDNVRVPKRQVVGEVDRGWYVAVTLLDFERSGVEYPTQARKYTEDLAQFAREADGGRLAKDPRWRARLAELYLEAQVGRLLAYHVAYLQSQKQVPNKEASISKVFGTELLQRVAHTGMEMLGVYGLLDKGAPKAPLGGVISRLWLCARSTSIGAGTSEIQRNIIALRGLGLPRG